MTRRLLLLLALALSSCTTIPEERLKQAADFTAESCRAYLAVIGG